MTELGPWGAFGVFAALVLAVAGVSIFSLGATFNYLVSLSTAARSARDCSAGPIFDPPLDRQFGWIGLLAAGIGSASRPAAWRSARPASGTSPVCGSGWVASACASSLASS